MGGFNGILTGLGVDSNSGLGIGGKASEPTEALSVVITDPASKKVEAVEGAALSDAGVYGPNILPPRMSKSLLELTWLTPKDKVSVSLSHAYVCSVGL